MPDYFHADDIRHSFARTMVAITKDPKHFFEHMNSNEGYKENMLLLSLLMLFPALEPVYYFHNLQAMLLIFPAIIAMGIFLGWLWSQYVCWALRVFLRIDIEKQAVFRVIAYANTPNVLHLTLILSPVALIWQGYLMWRGFVSHLGINTEVATWLIILPFIVISFSGLGIVMFMGITGIIHFE